MSEQFDLAIVGGGLVGASLACALAGSPLRIAVIEAVAPTAPAQPSYDDRTTALAPATQRVFQAIGLWRELRTAATPIREIHVSERGGFGFTRMSAADEGVEALGYVLNNRALGAVLPPRLRAQGNLELLCPASIESLERDSERVRLELTVDGAPRRIETRLLVAADGANSQVRDWLGIGVRRRDYDQHAVICNLTPERDHRGRAFERFTSEGPMALLPVDSGRVALIWSVPSERADAVLALDDAAFIAEVQQRFGYRLGRFLKAGARSSYPLRLSLAESVLAPRAVVIGNAARTLHPVAGQGFNLAMRDVAALAEAVHAAALRGEDIGAAGLLAEYAELRHADASRVAGFCDFLVRVFSNAVPGLGAVRNAGLLALDLWPAGKREFVRQAMGRNGSLSRLARGLPLPEAP